MKTPASLSTFIQIQETGAWVIPIDHFTDCRYVFHLVVGEKGVPQDRYQRLYILALREDRIKGTIRYFIWIPTAAMLDDPLTKSMISPMLHDLITHGYWGMNTKGPNGQEQKPLIAIQDQTTLEYSEDDLINVGKTKKRYGNNFVSTMPVPRRLYSSAAVLSTTSTDTPCSAPKAEICDLGSTLSFTGRHSSAVQTTSSSPSIFFLLSLIHI